MIGIFLDDERYPEDVDWVRYPSDVEWVIVRGQYDFKETITDACVTESKLIVTFDHDLGIFSEDGEEVTGKTLTMWMCSHLMDMKESGQQIPEIDVLCHSKNPIGVTSILSFWDFFHSRYLKK